MLLAAVVLATNAVIFYDPPSWLKEQILERVARKIEKKLEWDIRRVQAYAYQDLKKFNELHGLGPEVKAFTRRKDFSIHVGPQVKKENFEAIFGHELVHVIVGQKYKESIPLWLEEGLANFAAGLGNVDYVWLDSKRPFLPLRSLVHPFQTFKETPVKGITPDFTPQERVRFHYQASRAAVELIVSRCDLTDLLQLSLKKSLEHYLKTLCELPELDESFSEWVRKKAVSARSNNK